MTSYYQETVDGETLFRFQPGERHEAVCRRLHALLAPIFQGRPTARLLPPRTAVEMRPGTVLRPDLAIVAAATGKAWLVAEVVDSADHRADTVVKKNLYEEIKLPRLWMVDQRYNNAEVYHGTPHGLALQGILAGRQCLVEALLPGFSVEINELFKG